jgi:hypothetical protein
LIEPSQFIKQTLGRKSCTSAPIIVRYSVGLNMFSGDVCADQNIESGPRLMKLSSVTATKHITHSLFTLHFNNLVRTSALSEPVRYNAQPCQRASAGTSGPWTTYDRKTLHRRLYEDLCRRLWATRLESAAWQSGWRKECAFAKRNCGISIGPESSPRKIKGERII